MCFRDVLDALRAGGMAVSSSQLRWAINSGKIDRPRLDGSLRFLFSDQQVAELRAYFMNRPVRGQKGCAETVE